jgi:hypothetical protein
VSEAQRRDPTGAAAHLVALRALHAFDPGLAERVRDDPIDDAPVLVVAPGTGMFASSSISGDDLWLASGWVTGAPDLQWDTDDE